MSLCPCGSRAEFDQCCGPLLAGTPANTAEALMRSRYTAYTRAEIDYLGRTLAPDIRADFDPEEARRNATDVTWEELTIRDTLAGGPDDETGEVEFVAKYRANGRICLHHERSTFRKQDGQWYFVDGVVNPKAPPKRVEKIGRNDPCLCGSGKKFKKCCGA